MGTFNSFNSYKPEPYLSEGEKSMVLEKIRSIYCEELHFDGALKNRRLVMRQDLPATSCIRLNISDGRLVFTEIPNNMNSLYLVIEGRRLQIMMNDPSAMKIYNPCFQCAHIRNPELGKAYKLTELGIDASKVKIKEGERTLYNCPWSIDHYREIRRSVIEAYLLRDGLIQFRLINVSDIPAVIFRRSVLYENAMDLVVDYGDTQKYGDHRVSKFADGLTIVDPVLHAALRQQASIFMIGNPYEGKYIYRVSFQYSDKLRDTFVDAEKYCGQSNVEYNRLLFENIG